MSGRTYFPANGMSSRPASGSSGVAVSVTASGSLSRSKVLKSGIAPDQYSSAADASSYTITPDARTVSFTSASGTTLSYNALSSDVGKTVCVPGAGRDDGFGTKDGWTTTISSVNAGTSATVANAFPTTVSSGTNLLAAVGTDWSTQLQSFFTAVGTIGAHSRLPTGNILFTTTIDCQPGLAPNLGLQIEGHNSGKVTQSAPGGTSLWYVGPVAGTQNGAGVPAIQAASTSLLSGLRLAGFSIRCFRALAVSTTVTGSQSITTTPATFNVASTAGFPAKGRFTIPAIASTTRSDTCGTTNTSTSVTDASINIGDVGKGVSGTGIPAGTVIKSVIPQTSFVMTQAATATNVSVSLTITTLGVEAQYTSVNSSTQFGGVQVSSGTFTTSGGENLRSVTAALYVDNFGNCDFKDLYVSGYFDNQTSNVNWNQGRAYWFCNPSDGFSEIAKCHSRYFQGGEDAFRYGTIDTGYGVHGNGGNCHIRACSQMSCSRGFQFQATSLMDGSTFSALKAISSTPGPTGAPGIYPCWNYFVDIGFEGNAFNGVHSEGAAYGMWFRGFSNTVNSGALTCKSATVGDGSAALVFTNNAASNTVNSIAWQGWSAGSPGSPSGIAGFSYGVLFDVNSQANVVLHRISSGFPVPGIAAFQNVGYGNVVKDGTATSTTTADQGTIMLWTPFVERTGFLSNTAASTYFLGVYGNTTIVSTGGSGSGATVFYIDPTWFAPGSFMQLAVRLITNAVAPTVNFTFGLYPATSFGGASGAVPTLAGVNAGGVPASVAINTPAANTGVQGKTVAFAMPAAGWYAVGVAVSGTQAAGAEEILQGHLMVGQPR